MIKQAYINGFMRKCAEHGVDGRKLIKYSEPFDLKQALEYTLDPPKYTVPDDAKPGIFSGLYNYGRGNLVHKPLSYLFGSYPLYRDAKHTAAVGKRQISEAARAILSKLKHGALATPAAQGIRR